MVVLWSCLRSDKSSRDRCLASFLTVISGKQSNLPRQTYTFNPQRCQNALIKQTVEGEVRSSAAIMPVKVTSDFILNLLNQAAAGNPVPLMELLDPEVRWRIGSDTKDDVAKTGIYVSSSISMGHRRRFLSGR